VHHQIEELLGLGRLDELHDLLPNAEEAKGQWKIP
jgi:hypothetical protein